VPRGIDTVVMSRDRNYRRLRLGFSAAVCLGVAGSALAAAPPTGNSARPDLGWAAAAAGALLALAAGSARRRHGHPAGRRAVSAGLTLCFLAVAAALTVLFGRVVTIQDHQATETVMATVNGCTADAGIPGNTCTYTWLAGGQAYSGSYSSKLHDGARTAIKIDPQDPSIADTSPGAVNGPYANYIYAVSAVLALGAAGFWFRAEFGDPGPPGAWARQPARHGGPAAS
jgi:hypothetical protein